MSTSNKSEKKTEKHNNEKVFQVRESYYTNLFKNDQYKSIYHLSVAIFIFILLDNILHDWLTSGRIHLGLRTMKKGFGKFDIALGVWTLMHILIIGLFYAFRFWINVLQRLKGYIALRRLWNYSCILGFTGFQLILLYVGTATCLYKDLPFASATALLFETLRLLMKAYAFVRTNAPRFLIDQLKSKRDTFQSVSMSSYLYYLFAPTLIYRDSYPRTNKIQWTFALKCLLELVTIMFLFSFIHERYIVSNFHDIGLRRLTKVQLADRYFSMVLPSSLILLGTGYLILHSWLNFTGEILCFGDRMYYQDWWTSAYYRTYYRTWNTVVHDWFYEYIYKDFMRISNGSKTCSSLIVFYISAVIHEYVLGFALRMFYPASFLFFGGFGVVVYFITKLTSQNVAKVFFWWSLLSGNATLVCIYSLEFFARANSQRSQIENGMQISFPVSVSWSFLD